MISQTDVGNEIICNTEVLTTILCDYNNVYILLRGDITFLAAEKLCNIC